MDPLLADNDRSDAANLRLQSIKDTYDLLGFQGGGDEMRERIAVFNWSTTPLGPMTCWPQSLRTAVGIILGSRAGRSSSSFT